MQGAPDRRPKGNLFEVSMGKSVDKFGNLQGASSVYYTKALKFQNELNEAFGTNIEQTMRYQALFNQMSKSLGIGNSASYTISENLTKLGIDMASLYNANESTVMEALRSGVLSGQTKSLKTYNDVPIEDFFDNDIPFTINADNMTVSNVTAIEDTKEMIKTFDLNVAQVRKILNNSIKYSFASLKTKIELQKALETRLNEYFFTLTK